MPIYITYNENDVPHALLEQGGYSATNAPETEVTKNDLVLQWDEPSGRDVHHAWVLNSDEALKNCSDQGWRDILPLHGIQVAHESQTFLRKYLVFVFQLKVIGLLSEKSEVWLSSETRPRLRYREINNDDARLEYRKVKKLALRSIHSLGLDFGMVIVGCNHNDHYVIRLTPKPILSTKIVSRMIREINKLHDVLNSTIDPTQVMLGTDPEFILRNKNGKFVLASKYFPKNGTVGCDQIWLRGDKTKSKLPIVEIRPAPSSEPRILFRNIYLRLIDASKKINDPNIEFLAGSSPMKGYPIGGHIHFSKINLNSFFLRALDNYLTLPLFILEDPSGFRRRPRYGYIGDFREQYHGGFEYRTPPSWLITPRITKGVLALAKLIACNYPQLRKVPLTNPIVQKAYYEGDQRFIYDVVLALWEDLRNLSHYETYKSYLEPFYESIVNHEQWDEMSDIRPRWRIPPYNKQ